MPNHGNFFLECTRPPLPFAFAPRDASTAWAYASCGHVIHQREQFVLGEIVLQREVPGQSFGFWERTMGHASRYCSLCTFHQTNDLIVCAVCGSLIGINYPICVFDYRGGRTNNPFWQYATHVKGHASQVVTCPYARCSSGAPLYSGRWSGTGVHVRKRAIYA